jgi:hypothetical protein
MLVYRENKGCEWSKSVPICADLNQKFTAPSFHYSTWIPEVTFCVDSLR